MVKSLKDFVAGIRDSRFKYVPDDVALVQTISSLQDTMFQLAIFYASHEGDTQISRFEGGLGENVCTIYFFPYKFVGFNVCLIAWSSSWKMWKCFKLFLIY